MRSRRRTRRWSSSASTIGRVRVAASCDSGLQFESVPSIENANRRKPRILAGRRKRDTVKYRVIQYSVRSQTDQARRMLQPQELVVARLLPTIRARLARELLHTYKMKQVDVARSMGITQAAVSHYNTQSRGVDQEMLRLFPEIKPYVHELSEQIAHGMTLSDQIASVNEFCSGLMLTARFCEYHKSMGDIDPHCTACFPSPPRPCSGDQCPPCS